MIDEEVGKYRKKSTAKGQPRSKHKHIYETVLLVSYFELPNIHTGKQIKKEARYPTKVCTICGRVDSVDNDEKWYKKEKHENINFTYFTKELSENALRLPVWSRTDAFDKFAKPEEVNDD